MSQFEDDLKRGQAGEQEFIDLTRKAGHVFVRTPGRYGDMMCVSTHEKVELKTDFWKLDKTPNFFIEYESHGKPSGPYSALSHGAKFFIFFFIKDSTWFVFKTQDLVDFMDKNADNYKKMPIRNAAWTTWGRLVPRQDLTHLEISLEDIKNG